MLTSDQLRTLSPICNLDHQLGRVSHSLKLIKCKFIIFHHFLQPYIMWLFLFSVLLWAWCFLQNQTIFKNLMMNRRKKTGKVCVSGYSREESFTPARLTMLLSLCSCSSCVFVRPFKCLFSSKTCFIWNSKSSFCSANSNKIDKIWKMSHWATSASLMHANPITVFVKIDVRRKRDSCEHVHLLGRPNCRRITKISWWKKNLLWFKIYSLKRFLFSCNWIQIIILELYHKDSVPKSKWKILC